MQYIYYVVLTYFPKTTLHMDYNNMMHAKNMKLVLHVHTYAKVFDPRLS